MSINFFKGHPSASLLPRTQLADAYRTVIVDTEYGDFEADPSNRHPLQYGTDPGNLHIREAVIRWSNARFGRPKSNPDSVNLTAGSSYGAANVLAACTAPHITKHVFLVSPTYFLINYAFVDAGFAGRMSGVLETPGGEYEIDLDGFERQLVALDAQHSLAPVGSDEINVETDPTLRGERKFYRYAMYLVPTFSNPGGLTYSARTRRRLLDIARKHDVLLISDDVYDFLAYSGTPPQPKLNHLDEDSLPAGWKFGNTVSNASFSKIIAPGLRCGWQETAAPALARQLATTGANKSGGTPLQLSTFVVHELIKSGELDRTIANFVLAFAKRAQTLLAALEKHLPRGTQVYGGDGGYFVWVRVEGVDMARIVAKLGEHNVVIPDGSHFEVDGDVHGWGKHYARLCVALLTEEQIERGIEQWGEVLRREHPELYT